MGASSAMTIRDDTHVYSVRQLSRDAINPPILDVVACPRRCTDRSLNTGGASPAARYNILHGKHTNRSRRVNGADLP
jgi:hypothetical protein